MITVSSQDEFLDISWTMVSKLEVKKCSFSLGDLCFAFIVKGHVDNFFLIKS